MTNLINMIGLANSAICGIAKGATEVINTKEHQKTVRLETKMGAVVNISDCLQQIIFAYSEYQTVVAQEKVRRCQIESWEKTNLAEIKKTRDIFLSFLDNSFSERAKIFAGLFDVVDQAMASGNNENLGLALDKIIELAKSSPLEDLANISTVQTALLDPNHEWKF
jgi:hypothetical protein